MELVLSLVAIGIIYSVVFLVKSLLAKNPGVDAKPMMTEVFPEIRLFESQPVYDEAPVLKKDNRNIKPLNRTEPVQKSDENKVDEIVKNKRFSINNKSEAKRAFIYSEIFNRKY